jgi:hypothetical protein
MQKEAFGVIESFAYFIMLAFPFSVVGLAYQGKDIVFRSIIEYSSIRDFGP